MPETAEFMRLLARIPAPGGGDIVSAGLVEGVQFQDGLLHIALHATRAELGAMEPVARQVEALARDAPGVRHATVVLTSHRAAAPPAPKPATGHGPPPGEKYLQNVPHIIAVASGKGGVGKSTVSVNLAVSLAARGLRVGLVDADVHGPSLARMLGVSKKPEIRGGLMVPIEVWGLKAMSMAFLVPEDQAMIWRGPMVMGALSQMLGQTDWGPLEVMVVDLPPGTGDAQLTLSQRVDLSGAVIVSTPQDIALLDARRGVAMFQKVAVPVLGVVENMSFFCCPHCGHTSPIFGHGGAKAEAEKLGVAFLGEVPLLLDVREAGDAGQPIVLSAPESSGARALRAVAEKIWAIVAA